jgi:tRNA-dihydrouridine synthase
MAVKAFKAAAAMSRRAVQGVMIAAGAGSETLFRQIDALAAGQKLNANIAEWAHQIRLFGNDGAHPGSDGLEEVTEAEAMAALGFLDELLKWLYILPDDLAKARARS